MEGLEEQLVNMSIFDFCDFLTGHRNNTGIMERLQKFLDLGVNRICDYLVDHKNNTEIMKKLEENYVNYVCMNFMIYNKNGKNDFTITCLHYRPNDMEVLAQVLLVLLLTFWLWLHSLCLGNSGDIQSEFFC